ncbi:MAG TPA: DUF6327 family protein [Flavobacteriaceae bacterium]|nr:DUF6327 family protein [Flavobacteriaceae bacterium]
MKYFNSFEELDRELEIRKLEVEIEKQRLLNNYSALKKSFSPTHLALDVGVSVAQKFLVSKLIYKFLPFLK